jgi:transposase
MERLHMYQIRDLIYRLRLGESDRQVARDLGLSRHTVQKYRALADERDYLDPGRALPTPQELLASLGPPPPPPQHPSTVTPYQEVVEDLLAQGVELTTVLQRLRDDRGYRGSYSSLRRFVRTLRPASPDVCVRVQVAPGEEAQVDFGPVGRLVDPRTGLPRPAFVFAMTLGFSRYLYAELVFDQKIGTWIACHRHAFEFFGAVPRRVVPDNLKAAVLVASLHDPVLGEAYRRMAQHYGFLISPTRPRTPRHKGKVESAIHYLERAFIAGQEFADIDVANARLRRWLVEVAGVRRHGTTGQAPLALFRAREQAAMLPLPAEPFDLVEVRRAKVHRDCHVVLDGSFYSVPWHHAGQTVEAYVGERVVELYRDLELLTTHPRAHGPGEWHTRSEHYPPEKAAYLERTPARCRELARQVGPATFAVVDMLLGERPLDRLRSVQAILRLEESVGAQRLEAACRRARHFGDVRYRKIKEILNAALDQDPLPHEPVSPVAPEPARVYTFARSVAEFFGMAEALR